MGVGIGRRGLVLLAGSAAACAGDGLLFGEIDLAVGAELARRPRNYVNGEARAFEVGREGRTAGVLWGTWHVQYDETTVLPRGLRQVFAEASSLSVEVVVDRVPPATRRAMIDVVNRGILRSDPAAVERLDLDTRRSLDAAELPSGSLSRYSLVGLAQLVERNAAVQASLLPPVGFVDSNLIGFARSISVPVRGLEEADAGLLQRLLYADPNGEDAASALRLALRRRPGVPGFVSWLRRRYVAGEIGVMLAGLLAWRAEAIDLVRSDRARVGLLTDRNVNWMPRLEATLVDAAARRKRAFVAFGAAHLTGDDGIVALLRGRGWNVLPCVGDRCSVG